jgi:hypothetical protein
VTAVVSRLPIPTFVDHGDVEIAACAVSYAARALARGGVLAQHDDERLDFAADYLVTAGLWNLHADALIVSALRRARAGGRRLEAADVEQLRCISARMHAHLAELDARVSA